MTNLIGVVSCISDRMSARKESFLRGIAWDIETQAVLFELHRKRVLSSLLDHEGRLRLLLKKKVAAAKIATKKKLTQQQRDNRAKGRGFTISPVKKAAALKKADRERKILSRTKGKGYKVISENVKKAEEEMESLRMQRLGLQKLVNAGLRAKRAEELRAAEEKRKEEDRRKTAEHKAKMLQDKKAAEMEAAWKERHSDRLVERYSSVEDRPTLNKSTIVSFKEQRLQGEKTTILGEIEKLTKQLEEQLSQ